MKKKADNLQAQFSGFYNTPHLFLKPINGMQPFIKIVKFCLKIAK